MAELAEVLHLIAATVRLVFDAVNGDLDLWRRVVMMRPVMVSVPDMNVMSVMDPAFMEAMVPSLRFGFLLHEEEQVLVAVREGGHDDLLDRNAPGEAGVTEFRPVRVDDEFNFVHVLFSVLHAAFWMPVVFYLAGFTPRTSGPYWFSLRNHASEIVA